MLMHLRWIRLTAGKYLRYVLPVLRVMFEDDSRYDGWAVMVESLAIGSMTTAAAGGALTNIDAQRAVG